jgi:hypothetical protein
MPQPRLFTNSASLSQGDILKTIQLNGSPSLWAEVDGLDAVIKKGKALEGKEIQFSFSTDAGGGAFGRVAQQGGIFLPGDRVKNIQGKAVGKLQGFTLEFEKFLAKQSKGNTAAFINNMEQEFQSKMRFQKSLMALQYLGDGSARHAEPVGLGIADTTNGANFTLAANNAPLKIKLSGSDTAAGSVAHFVEGAMVSFVYCDMDPGNTGAGTVTQANGIVRNLVLEFTQTDTKAYDAFRVVKIEQETNYIYVLPGRQVGSSFAGLTPDSVGEYVQRSNWTDTTGVVTVTARKGVRADLVASSIDTQYNVLIADFGSVFSLTASTDLLPTKVALISPMNISQEQTGAKNQLGIGITSSTDLAMVHDGVFTGLDTLLCNETNVVHGIDRANVLQYLATSKDNQQRDLTFNSFFSFLTQHVNRNRNMKFDWSVLMLNPIVMSSMMSLSELDKRIIDGVGIRGDQGAKTIKMGEKTFELEQHSSMRLDRVFAIAKGAVELHGGNEELVDSDGVTQFLAVTGGRRTNVAQSHYLVNGELTMETPRVNAFMRNFKITTY